MLKDLEIITENIVTQPIPTWLVVTIFIVSLAFVGLSYYMFKRHEHRKGNDVDIGSWVCVLMVSTIICISSLYRLTIPQKTVYEYVVRVDKESDNVIQLHVLYDVVSSNDDIYVIRTTEKVE